MSGRGRALVAIGAVAVVVVLFFVFRSGGEDSEATTTEAVTTIATTETMSTTATEPPPPPPPPPGPVRARITVANGEVVGGRRLLKVEQGKQFVLIVNADVADHVHLHGYDLMADVAPGKPARIRLKASIAGRFEIELEDRGLALGELEVRP
jgi:hypothetical protein